MQWAKTENNIPNAYTRDITLDAYGSPFVTGYLSCANSNFGNGVTTSGCSGFILKYDVLGNAKLVRTGGGDIFNSCAVNAYGEAFVIGPFSYPGSYFGTITLPAYPCAMFGPCEDMCIAATNFCFAFPGQPSAIAGNISVCQGSSQTYSISFTGDADKYVWTLPNGWTGYSATNSITVTAGNISGNISVVGYNSCGAGYPRTLAVTTNPVPTVPTSISVSGGNVKVCPGDTRTYSTPLVAGVTYNWTVPTGAVLISGQGTRTINVTYNSNFTANGVISVVKVSGGCSSLSRNLNVNRNIPSTPSAITGTTYGLCGATNKVYSVTQVAGMTYQWTVPATATIVNGQGTNAITVNFPSTNFTGTVSVKAVNGCSAGNARNLTVRAIPSTPLSITGPATACAQQQNVAYSTAAVTSATAYTCLVPSGALVTAGQGTTSIMMNYGTAGGNVRVRAVNGCGNSSYRNLVVTINCREGEADDAFDVLVYPNPSKNYFTINVSNSNENNYSLIVRDVIRRVVYQQENISTDGSFDFGTEFLSGVYFAEIKQGDERKIVRLIKSN